MLEIFNNNYFSIGIRRIITKWKIEIQKHIGTTRGLNTTCVFPVAPVHVAKTHVFFLLLLIKNAQYLRRAFTNPYSVISSRHQSLGGIIHWFTHRNITFSHSHCALQSNYFMKISLLPFGLSCKYFLGFYEHIHVCPQTTTIKDCEKF